MGHLQKAGLVKVATSSPGKQTSARKKSAGANYVLTWLMLNISQEACKQKLPIHSMWRKEHAIENQASVVLLLSTASRAVTTPFTNAPSAQVPVLCMAACVICVAVLQDTSTAHGSA